MRLFFYLLSIFQLICGQVAPCQNLYLFWEFSPIYLSANRHRKQKSCRRTRQPTAYFENTAKIYFSFPQIYKKNSKKFSAGSEFKKLIKKKENLASSGGTSESSAEGTKHTYSDAERVAFVDWINTALQDDTEAKAYLPMNPVTSELFEKMNDGIILW